jgi:nucleotide-binding universal stress UspA family protein
VYVLVVPLDKPLDADLPEEEAEAEALLDSAQAFLENYGVRAVTRLVRARSAGPAIVEEVERRNAELVVLGSPRGKARRGKPIFGHTVDYVLKHSPSRVLLVAGRRAA